MRAGYGASTIPFPDNRYAFNYPVKQNYSGTAANGFQRAGLDGDRLPGAGAARTFRRTASFRSSGVAAERDLRRDPDTTCTRARCTRGTSRSSASCRTCFTADIAYVGNRGVDLVMDVDTNASLVYGSGNAGRPQFATVQPHRHSAARAPTTNKSQYNGLQMKVDRRFRNGLLRDQLVHAEPVDGLRRTRTPASARRSTSSRAGRDRTSIGCTTTSLTGVYELPWGPNKRWLNDRHCSARSSAAGR